MLLAHLAAAAAAATLVVRCGSSGGSSGGGHAVSAGRALKTAKIGGATVLTNSEGFTLYSFGLDTSTKSNCNGQCAASWPPVMGSLTAPGVNGTFGTIKLSDGSIRGTTVTPNSRAREPFSSRRITARSIKIGPISSQATITETPMVMTLTRPPRVLWWHSVSCICKRCLERDLAASFGARFPLSRQIVPADGKDTGPTTRAAGLASFYPGGRRVMMTADDEQDGGRRSTPPTQGQAMFTHARWATGLALLAALAAGCGTATASHPTAHPAKPTPTPAIHSAAPTPATGHHHRHARRAHPAVTTPPAPPASAPAPTANPIPQGNGGDQDADNNGGPSDGDGNI
jgi:predicted lipoprotein with Yx(FWY)xxD motif